MRRSFGFFLFWILFVALGSTAHASGYIGLGAYTASADVSSDSTLTPAFMVGWRPIELLGVELGYYDFGNFKESGVRIDGSALTLAGLLSLELGPVGLYGKLGLARYDFDYGSPLVNDLFSDSTSAFGGFGATVDIMDRLYFYAEYLRFGAGADLDVLGAGVRFSFW
jgi:hypothetical protein